MPYYTRAGQIPDKRHTAFRQPDGRLYAEELVSTEGFSSLYSLVYHVFPPTRVVRHEPPRPFGPLAAIEHNIQCRRLLGYDLKPVPDYLESRTPILFNNDVCLSLAAPQQSMEGHFYKNAQADEVLFIHQGSGELITGYGVLRFQYGDYLHVPRGVIYQVQFDTPENRLLIIESYSPVCFPKKYLNRYGQLEEHSPIHERDLVLPVFEGPTAQEGEHLIYIKKANRLYPTVYNNHPFDFIGWDGCFYPYSFSIHQFEPITGRVHQPPPVHQTFDAHNFVICSFVPRLFDYHPRAVPAPYHHSNVDSDEVLYYVDGDFMSRNNIRRGDLTLHPLGLPHGPHPGAAERSIGAKETHELAVMVDTFHPLQLTDQALVLEDPDYHRSWLNCL
jgi:homogentisate 1,2-dioxygenase